MAKAISYKIITKENPGIEQITRKKRIVCDTQAQFDANYPIAQKEAVGEITVTGEFDPAPDTVDAAINALLGVTA